MPWHQSKSDPRKVYNESHEVVGVMQTSEQAAHIVAAVNYYDKLTGRKEHGQVQSTGAPMEQADAPVITHTFQDDECCGKSLSRWIRKGCPGTERMWSCPRCGCEWAPIMVNPGVVHWCPTVFMEVIRCT